MRIMYLTTTTESRGTTLTSAYFLLKAFDMKIINLTEFRGMPQGTVFCKYDPCCFGELQIKGETWDSDFISAPLTGVIESEGSSDMFEKLIQYEKTKESFSLDIECYGRDGLFEPNQLFAVYEKKDIAQLANKLMTLL